MRNKILIFAAIFMGAMLAAPSARAAYTCQVCYTDCKAGYGANSAAPCPVCNICAKGTFKQDPGLSQCSSCEEGFSQPNEGQTFCTQQNYAQNCNEKSKTAADKCKNCNGGFGWIELPAGSGNGTCTVCDKDNWASATDGHNVTCKQTGNSECPGGRYSVGNALVYLDIGGTEKFYSPDGDCKLYDNTADNCAAYSLTKNECTACQTEVQSWKINEGWQRQGPECTGAEYKMPNERRFFCQPPLTGGKCDPKPEKKTNGSTWDYGTGKDYAGCQPPEDLFERKQGAPGSCYKSSLGGVDGTGGGLGCTGDDYTYNTSKGVAWMANYKARMPDADRPAEPGADMTDKDLFLIWYTYWKRSCDKAVVDVPLRYYKMNLVPTYKK